MDIKKIKLILIELTKPRFDGDLGWDDDRIALIKKAYKEIEKYENEVNNG